MMERVGSGVRDDSDMSMAPGWYPDPFSAGYLRWWDGTAWGSATQVAQRADTPPAPQPPGPAPAAPGYGTGQAYGAPDPAQGPYQSTPQQGAPPPAPPWADYRPYPPQAPAPDYPLASWGSRLAARLIDWVLVGVVIVPIYIVVLWPAISDFMSRLPTDSSQPVDPQVLLDFQQRVVGQALLLGLLAALVQLAYEVPQLVAYGRTLGKRALGIRVRPLAQDRNPSWGEALGRTGVMVGGNLLASGLFTLLDCLWPLWDRPWQQALHDKAVKTVVVPR
jgi:uncharacterized RDD family membrane protein YckC